MKRLALCLLVGWAAMGGVAQAASTPSLTVKLAPCRACSLPHVGTHRARQAVRGYMAADSAMRTYRIHWCYSDSRRAVECSIHVEWGYRGGTYYDGYADVNLRHRRLYVHLEGVRDAHPFSESA